MVFRNIVIFYGRLLTGKIHMATWRAREVSVKKPDLNNTSQKNLKFE